MSTLQKLRVPGVQNDLIFSGLIKDIMEEGGHIRIALALHQDYRVSKKLVSFAVEEAGRNWTWFQSVTVEMAPETGVPLADGKSSVGVNQASRGPKNGLGSVKHIVAVSSCKGGVGKSTVAVNLAFALSLKGARVGILDADVYGPSLPSLVSVPGAELLTAPNGLIVCPEYKGVKLMSYGFANTPSESGTIMRGPMVSKLVRALATEAQWGKFQFLLMH